MGSQLLLLLVSLLLCLSLTLGQLNKETDCKCRIQTKSRIVNGRFAHHKSYPFLVSLFNNKYRFTKSKSSIALFLLRWSQCLNVSMTSNDFLLACLLSYPLKEPLRKLLPDSVKMSGLTCSGLIINPRFLITASACLAPKLEHLTIGLPHSNDLLKMFDDDHIPIKRVIRHPNFNETTAKKDFGYNLALIELEQPINFTDTVSPACLAVSAKNRGRIYPSDQLLTSAGYGAIVNQIDNFKSRLLKEIDLVDHSADTEECQENAKLMCLKSADKRDTLALNDLGGGVVATQNGRSYVTSVLSNLEIAINHENETAYLTDLSFAARLVESIDWIRQHVDDDYCSDE